MYTNYSKRKEFILCISHNTLKLNDLPLLDIINSSIGESFSEIQNIGRVINRVTYELAPENDINREVFDNLRYATYVDCYRKAPYTTIKKMLNTLKDASFIGEIFMLYNTFGGRVDVSTLPTEGYTKLSYNGGYEELTNLIIEKGITTVILDDIDILYHIVNNLDVDGMSFILSKIGYNFIKEDGCSKLKLKHDILTISETKKKFEFAIIDLCELTADNVAEMKANG